MPPSTLAPNTILGGHRIVSALTSGGMGAVYVAEHIQTGRRRALKIMAPHFVSDDKLRRRFEQEAKIGALIESDHVVEVQDAGVDPATDMPWLAMELLKGEELGDLVKRRGALPPAEVHEIYKQLCHALTAAHAQGIVHRDLKPENLFLATARRPDVPFTLKILDFGIAKIVAEVRTTATDMIGSPYWMAPEQARQGVGVTPATDVWALGLIAFRLLAGKIYWLTPHGPDPSTMKLLQEIGIDPLAPASARAAALGVAHLLPPGFDAWFDRCVRRVMMERFPSAREAWAALDPILAPTARDLILVQAAPPLATVPIDPARMAAIVASERIDSMPGASTTNAPTLKVNRPPPSPGPSRSSVWLAGGAAVALAASGALFLASRGSAPGPTATASTSELPVVPAPSSASPLPKAPLRDKIAFDAATFTMGNDAKKTPAHKVFVPAFVLDRTEVTVAAYRACVDVNKCAPPEPPDASTRCNYTQPDHDDHPVDCVTQAQASAYCAWKGMRLPTEEEWEYAARGTEGRPFPWKGEGPTPARACYDHPLGTCPAGSHPEGDTLEGVSDMAGNVWEWTKSPSCPYLKPQCGSHEWVIRGGSASSKAEMIAATIRFAAPGENHFVGYGFRCAADGAPGKP